MSNRLKKLRKEKRHSRTDKECSSIIKIKKGKTR